jgi:hypothetical protein
MEEFNIISCPVCGKRFVPAVYHSWTIYDRKKGCKRKVCGYNCMRKYERENPKKYHTVT